ncbi:MAG: hypothetical protein FWG55_01745 [Candidatus Bathyarchaeota archaeon]|nr:hypothetical protein [Candidatus Termiticorpusculum sp.]
MNAIGLILKVKASTILYGVKNFVLKTYKKPTPQGEVIIELDKMGHFIRAKKQGRGMEGVLLNYRRTG